MLFIQNNDFDGLLFDIMSFKLASIFLIKTLQHFLDFIFCSNNQPNKVPIFVNLLTLLNNANEKKVMKYDLPHKSAIGIFLPNIHKLLLPIYVFKWLPREPHRSTRLPKLTGRWQYDGIMWLALCSIKSNNVDFLNQIRYFLFTCKHYFSLFTMPWTGVLSKF